MFTTVVLILSFGVARATANFAGFGLCVVGSSERKERSLVTDLPVVQGSLGPVGRAWEIMDGELVTPV